ncbi:gp21 [Salmonella phage FO1a]|uniref:Gp21 n=1 Tax=Salmonella phage FO1a TaxID=1087480 RepID=K9K9R3_9CAUD|nr:gp21 [Salmonella phage FO1a]
MAYVTVITNKADSSWSTQVSDKMSPMQCLNTLSNGIKAKM